jgi:hypothetical protein
MSLPDPAQLQRIVEQPSIDAVVKFLRDDKIRTMRVDVETDSTIQPDEQAEKEARIEFLTAMTPFLEKAAMMGAQMPPAVPLLGELMMFAVRGFKTARPVEAAFDEFLEATKEQAKQPRQPKPDPAMLKAENDAKVAEAGLKIKAMEAQADQQLGQQRLQGEMQLQAAELQGQQQIAEADLAQRAQQGQAELMLKARENAQAMMLKAQQMRQQHSLAEEQARMRAQMGFGQPKAAR